MIPAFVTMAIYYDKAFNAELRSMAAFCRDRDSSWSPLSATGSMVMLRAATTTQFVGVILDPIADKGLLLSGIIT